MAACTPPPRPAAHGQRSKRDIHGLPSASEVIAVMVSEDKLVVVAERYLTLTWLPVHHEK